MNQTTYFLRTNRIGFKHWQESDLDLAVGLWGDYEVTKLFDARGALSRDQVRERLLKEIDGQQQHGFQYWPIFNLKTDEHVGCCGLRPYELEKRVYEIGFHIRSDQWRRGYAREAATAAIDFAFNSLGAKGLFAGHNPKNQVSRHLLAKLGFQYTHDEYYPPTGLNHPSYLMTSEEYSNANPTKAGGEAGRCP